MENENLKYILVRTDGTYSIVEISDNDFLSQTYKLLECEFIETVPLLNNELMICDEYGKLKPHRVNFLCSCLYQTVCGGDYMAGHVLIGKRVGCDIVGLTPDAINRYVTLLDMHGYENVCH